MKPRTYFRLALLTPFILWVGSLLVSLLVSEAELQGIWEVILAPFVIYAIGILLWFLPYMILAIGFWIWSKNRSISALRIGALTAPIFFYLLMLTETGWAYLSTDSLFEAAKKLAELAIFIGVLSMGVGYLFVGIAFLGFKFLQTRNFIMQETAPEY